MAIKRVKRDLKSIGQTQALIFYVSGGSNGQMSIWGKQIKNFYP